MLESAAGILRKFPESDRRAGIFGRKLLQVSRIGSSRWNLLESCFCHMAVFRDEVSGSISNLNSSSLTLRLRRRCAAIAEKACPPVYRASPTGSPARHIQSCCLSASIAATVVPQQCPLTPRLRFHLRPFALLLLLICCTPILVRTSLPTLSPKHRLPPKSLLRPICYTFRTNRTACSQIPRSLSSRRCRRLKLRSIRLLRQCHLSPAHSLRSSPRQRL